MKKLLIILFFYSTSSFGQIINTIERSGEQNIYNDAIKQYIVLVSKNNKSIFDTLIVVKDDLLTDSLMSTIQGTRIILIDSSEISNRLKDENSMIVHRIFPLSFDNERFFISIVSFSVHQENGEIVFKNSGSCIVSYIYNNDTNEFKFYRSVCNGL